MDFVRYFPLQNLKVEKPGSNFIFVSFVTDVTVGVTDVTVGPLTGFVGGRRVHLRGSCGPLTGFLSEVQLRGSWVFTPEKESNTGPLTGFLLATYGVFHLRGLYTP